MIVSPALSSSSTGASMRTWPGLFAEELGPSLTDACRLEHVVPAARGVVVDHSVEAFSVDDVELILCGGRDTTDGSNLG